MSIGENWRQISPGNVSGGAGGANGLADSKFAQSNAADQLSGNGEGRTFRNTCLARTVSSSPMSSM